MLFEYEKRLIEKNMHTVEIVVKLMMAKYNIPKNEYEDYCQIGYLILCDKVHKYDGSVKFSTFANTVLTNAFIDKYRRDKIRIRETISLDDVCDNGEGDDGACLADFLAADVDTENEVLSKLTNDMIKDYIRNARNKCSAATTAKGFEALELKLDGYSGKEIADMFNVPSNSLRSWMSRAKKVLLNDINFTSMICD